MVFRPCPRYVCPCCCSYETRRLSLGRSSVVSRFRDALRIAYWQTAFFLRAELLRFRGCPLRSSRGGRENELCMWPRASERITAAKEREFQLRVHTAVRRIQGKDHELTVPTSSAGACLMKLGQRKADIYVMLCKSSVYSRERNEVASEGEKN